MAGGNESLNHVGEGIRKIAQSYNTTNQYELESVIIRCRCARCDPNGSDPETKLFLPSSPNFQFGTRAIALLTLRADNRKLDGQFEAALIKNRLDLISLIHLFCIRAPKATRVHAAPA